MHRGVGEDHTRRKEKKEKSGINVSNNERKGHRREYANRYEGKHRMITRIMSECDESKERIKSSDASLFCWVECRQVHRHHRALQTHNGCEPMCDQ